MDTPQTMLHDQRIRPSKPFNQSSMHPTLPRRYLHPILVIALCIAAAPASAVRFYDVEMILFENTDTAQVNQEVWPEVDTVGEPSALNLFGVRGDVPITNSDFRVLGVADKQLGGTRARLNNAANYRPILHLAWRQPGLGASKAIPVKIAGGRRYVNPAALRAEPAVPAAPANTTNTTQAVNAADLGALSPLLASAEPAEVDEIEGTVKIVLGRYLHVHTDLAFRRLMPSQFGIQPVAEKPQTTTEDGAVTTPETLPPPSSKLTGFRMKQHRRMRSNELHYIDHPAFGMIVIIRRAPEQSG